MSLNINSVEDDTSPLLSSYNPSDQSRYQLEVLFVKISPFKDVKLDKPLSWINCNTHSDTTILETCIISSKINCVVEVLRI